MLTRPAGFLDDIWSEPVDIGSKRSDISGSGAGRTVVVDDLETLRSSSLRRSALEGAVDSIVIRPCVDDSTSGPGGFLAALALLRDCISLRIPVVWSAGQRALEQRDDLIHLAPPANDATWQAQHLPYLCYLRKGLGFAALVDERPGRGYRVVVDEPAYVELVFALEDPQTVA